MGRFYRNTHLIIEGDYYVEPSITYRTNGAYYMRTWVKFRIKSDQISSARLYQRIDHDIQTNTWYEGYVDLNLRTNNIGSDGSDLTIDYDSITLTGTVSPTK